MGFRECTKMDLRRGLARLVLEDGVSVSAAARAFGVSRVTAHLWVKRAREQGLAMLSEISRRPHTSPSATSPDVVKEFLTAKSERPYWGAQKLVPWHWGDAPPISVTTANRILSRHGLTVKSSPDPPAVTRFEHSAPNELWQMDFKGLKYPKLPYEAFSVVDDCSRYCLAFTPVPNQTLEAVWEALWNLFGQYGLPERILSDNGPAFRGGATRLPGALDARLWRLGVGTTHGRPWHPQTQGKVERFHLTVETELGSDVRQASSEEARVVFEVFRTRYNWERPHGSLAHRTPGTYYQPSERVRPDKLPEHEIPEGAISRRTDAWGNFGYKGGRYKVGRGLGGQRVELRQGQDDLEIRFCGILIGNLNDFKV